MMRKDTKWSILIDWPPKHPPKEKKPIDVDTRVKLDKRPIDVNTKLTVDERPIEVNTQLPLEWPPKYAAEYELTEHNFPGFFYLQSGGSAAKKKFKQSIRKVIALNQAEQTDVPVFQDKKVENVFRSIGSIHRSMQIVEKWEYDDWW